MNNFSSLQQMMTGPPSPQMQSQMQVQMPQQAQQQSSTPKGIVSDKPYVCEICGRGYSYLASLEQHKVRSFTSAYEWNYHVLCLTFTYPTFFALFHRFGTCLEKEVYANGGLFLKQKLPNVERDNFNLWSKRMVW